MDSILVAQELVRIDRDLNAAKNVLSVGRHTLAQA